jgi:hypothetical protein
VLTAPLSPGAGVLPAQDSDPLIPLALTVTAVPDRDRAWDRVGGAGTPLASVPPRVTSRSCR